MRTIRASELSTYLYCKRAWWYRQQGLESQNQGEMQSGVDFHQQHAAKAWSARLLRLLGWCLLLAALTLLAIALARYWTA